VHVNDRRASVPAVRKSSAIAVSRRLCICTPRCSSVRPRTVR
jgi:hypothetical protein